MDDDAVWAIEGAYVATLDPGRRELTEGHVLIEGNRIVGVGPGPAPTDRPLRRVVDGRGCLLTPGLVNTHQHLYQWVTRGLAVDATLFEWLSTLYPVWAGIDEDAVHTAAQAALSQMALTGCTTAFDHHYVFPREGGDVFGAEVRAAQEVGVRFHPARGSMDLSVKDGGLPPDSVVQGLDEVLAATEAAIDAWHDPAPGSMLRVAVAPCSPFSVTEELMRQAAELARRRDVLLHTHLAETTDESDWCAENRGCTPLQYAEELGWSGPDVWFAHGIHFDDAEIGRLGRSGTGVAHCPSSNARLGAGIARSADLRSAGVPVGLGVDGTASNEAGSLLEEARHAVLFARARGGPQALGVRDALEMATLGGARVLGRHEELGSVEVGKLADLALWRLDALPHAGIADPVAALVLGAAPPVELLIVNGRTVVEQGRMVTVDEEALAERVAHTQRALLARAG